MSEQITSKIDAAVADAQSRLANAASADDIEQVRIDIFGRQGCFRLSAKK